MSSAPTLLNGTPSEQALDAVLSEFWFPVGASRARLNERERKALVDHLQEHGFRVVKRRRPKNRD